MAKATGCCEELTLRAALVEVCDMLAALGIEAGNEKVSRRAFELRQKLLPYWPIHGALPEIAEFPAPPPETPNE